MRYEFILDGYDGNEKYIESQKVGQAEMYLFDTNKINYDLYTTMDDFSHEAIQAFFSVYIEGESKRDREEYHEHTHYIDGEFPFRLVYFHTIEIEKKYRGKGYFKKAMKMLIRDLEKEFVDYILLMPSPFEREGNGNYIQKGKKEKERIRAFYESIGFEKTIGLLNDKQYFLIGDFTKG